VTLAPDAVRTMFDRIAPVYDVMNRVMTMGLDVRWRRLAARAVVRPGDEVLDAACGTGDFAVADLAAGAHRVVGLDFSEAMLQRARRKAPQVEWVRGDMLALPFADASFDVAVSTQVYEYVEDMPAALAEVRRVLRPGGRLLVLDTDWDSLVWHSRDPQRMRRVVAAWDEHLADPYLPRRLPGLLEDAGFTLAAASVFTMLDVGWDPGAFSAGLVDMMATYVPGHGGVSEAETAAWADDLRSMGRDGFFSLGRYLFLATA
jgi:arsenite methyltransferase